MSHKLGKTSPEVRRRVLVLADQAASSLSNVVVAVLVARSVSASEFGAFGLAMVVYGLALGACRALMGETFINGHAADLPEVRRELLSEVLGATATVGAACSLVVAIGAVITDGAAARALLALAVCLPLVLIQDVLRFVFVIDRAASALLIDVLWLVLVLFPLLGAPGDAGGAWFVLAWGLSGAVAALIGCALSGAPMRTAHPWRWLVRSRRTAARFLGEFVTAQGSAQIPMLFLGAVSGLPTLGAVRATQVFYGPLNTIHGGAYLAVVPDGARLRRDRRRLMRLITMTSAGLALLATLWLVVGASLPDDVGVALFDRTWPGASEIMVPMGCVMIAGGLISGGFLGVRSLGASRLSLRSRLLSAPGQVVLPLVGAVLGDAVGFALGLAVARAIASGIWWSAFVHESRRQADAETAADHRVHVLPTPAVVGATTPATGGEHG